MARTSLATQLITAAGLTPALTVPTVDGDVMDSNNAALMVVNGSGAPINVTIQTPATGAGLAIEERIVAVAAGATKLIGPFPREFYGQPAGADKGRVYVNYSAQASVTRGAVGF